MREGTPLRRVNPSPFSVAGRIIQDGELTRHRSPSRITGLLTLLLTEILLASSPLLPAASLLL